MTCPQVCLLFGIGKVISPGMENVLAMYVPWDRTHLGNIKQAEGCAGSPLPVISSPRRALVKFLSCICLTSRATKLKTHFALFSFSSLYRLQRKFGRNRQLHRLLNLDVLLFVVLAKLWENLPQTVAYVSSLPPIWHPDIPAMVWKGGKPPSLKEIWAP